MKNYLFIVFICLHSFSSFSQIAFLKGYIVNDKGDTIRGEVKINPKKEQDNYSKVFFKEESGTQKSYKPNKVKAYGFDNQHFTALDYDGELKFYKVLVIGEISLYKMMFEVINMNAVSYAAEYFITRKEDKKMTSVKENKFKKQLQEMMSGAAGFANEYDGDKKINEESAIQVIKKYNNRTGNE
ncbi:MAG: hypothetical protein Q7W45_11890 [Bacteroidota bacterium]|nr:hypothetical protein [Bacteroidota bacterium]MDP3146972.1 hypothetical protein [Bacteroidota bacterium]